MGAKRCQPAQMLQHTFLAMAARSYSRWPHTLYGAAAHVACHGCTRAYVGHTRCTALPPTLLALAACVAQRCCPRWLPWPHTLHSAAAPRWLPWVHMLLPTLVALAANIALGAYVACHGCTRAGLGSIRCTALLPTLVALAARVQALATYVACHACKRAGLGRTRRCRPCASHGCTRAGVFRIRCTSLLPTLLALAARVQGWAAHALPPMCLPWLHACTPWPPTLVALAARVQALATYVARHGCMRAPLGRPCACHSCARPWLHACRGFPHTLHVPTAHDACHGCTRAGVGRPCACHGWTRVQALATHAAHVACHGCTLAGVFPAFVVRHWLQGLATYVARCCRPCACHGCTRVHALATHVAHVACPGCTRVGVAAHVAHIACRGCTRV